MMELLTERQKIMQHPEQPARRSPSILSITGKKKQQQLFPTPQKRMSQNPSLPNIMQPTSLSLSPREKIPNTVLQNKSKATFFAANNNDYQDDGGEST